MDLHEIALKTHRLLLGSGQWLATAESCTGGMLSSSLIDHAGSSSYFDRGFVTYSNAAKEDMLGVTRECLDRHGAVSQETAKAMAEGALANSSATLSLSITGIAGPGGGSNDKPVGTVCFAWAQKNSDTRTATKLFEGDRTAVRQQAACHALKELQKYISPERA